MAASHTLHDVLRSKPASAGILAIVVTLALVVVLKHFSRGVGVREFVASVVHRGIGLGRTLLDARSFSQKDRGDFTDVVFLHHSVGANLIRQGSLRERLTASGFRFWDQDYNQTGLTGPDGKPRGYAYWIPGDNTNPDGYAGLFAQRVYGLPWNALSGLLQHEVIVFKSCYPVSDIRTDGMLEEYRSYYRSVRSVMDRHPDHVFIVVTPPPLNPASTSAPAAARARSFADWLGSADFLEGHPNVFTFDLFGNLEDKNPASPEAHMLRRDYRDGDDSHPNAAANRAIAPLLADLIASSARGYAKSWTAASALAPQESGR